MIRFNLAIIMAKRGIHRQARLHEMTGIRKNTISDIFNNTASSIALQDLDAICKALKCEITDVLEQIPDPPKDSESTKDSELSARNSKK